MALAFLRYRPVFAASDLSRMIKLEAFLQLKQCRHCYIDMEGFPVYLMKCPAAVSASVRQWIKEEEFVCQKG